MGYRFDLCDVLVAYRYLDWNFDDNDVFDDLNVNGFAAGVRFFFWLKEVTCGEIGINDQFMKDLSATFMPGTSALFVLVKKSTPGKVLDALKNYRGKVLKISLTADKEETLRAVLEGSDETAGW